MKSTAKSAMTMTTQDDCQFVCVSAAALPAGQMALDLPALGLDGMTAYLAQECRMLYWNRAACGGDRFADLEQVQFLLLRRKSDYVLLLPLIWGDYRAFLRTADGGLRLCWEGALAEAKEPATPAELLLYATGGDPLQLVAGALKTLRQRLGSFRLREEKETPAFVDYLGWCTWDAFYQEVDQEKVLQGLKSFRDGGVTPGFVLLDDGWLSADEGGRLTAFRANPKKFPEGLAPLIEQAKRDYGVKMFGVWHAFEGYWRGVSPTGELAQHYRTVANTGDITPWQPKEAELSMVHVDDIQRFYNDFHQYLRQQGVDIVKVDGQGALEVFSKGKFGRVSAMRAYQQAYQASSQLHFRGNAISCMCNPTDIAYNMLGAQVWRNSDDYFPKQPASHGKHVWWNATSALWTSNFGLPDWDMFWSSHEEGEFHAIARALSGGPVYVSDKPEAHDFELLKRLITSEGKVLRSDRPALPCVDTLFVDPTVEKRLFKVSNHTGTIGVIGIFNCCQEAGAITDTFCPADVPEIVAEDCVVYLRQAAKALRVKRDQKVELALPALKAEVVVVSPVLGGWIAPLGLLDKYNIPAGVVSCALSDEGECTAEFRDGGTLAFWCASEPQVVAVSVKSEISYAEGLLRITAQAGSPVRVRIAAGKTGKL